MAILIDGKAVSSKVKEEVAAQVQQLNQRGDSVGLDVVLVGENPASKVYVRNKHKDCQKVGIRSAVHDLPQETTEEELIHFIQKLNNDPNVNGILIQLPLPGHLSEEAVIAAIDPGKDVDAFSVGNVGKIMLGKYDFLPCTPAGVMELLAHYNIDVKGKHCVVIGRSNIVGKPMAMLLMHAHATVTICHSRTVDLASITRQADLIVAAVGREGIVTGEMVKEGAILIDVGMNRNAEGKLCGDIDFGSAEKKASYITPVPGGVGPMTRAVLLKNTIKAACLQNGIRL